MEKISGKNFKNISVPAMVEDIIGCKWSLTTLELIRKGINRPGAMVREVDGLTTKVLNERLSKMVKYGVLEKVSYPEIPPRVEYEFTDFGERFCLILDDIGKLQQYLNSQLSGNEKDEDRE